jgi:hypothetical protein
MVESMLTTDDNPYDPFTQFDMWLAFDTRMGYNTLGLLARIVITSDQLSEPDQSLKIELGIEEIVRENALGIHRRVTREVPNTF